MTVATSPAPDVELLRVHRHAAMYGARHKLSTLRQRAGRAKSPTGYRQVLAEMEAESEELSELIAATAHPRDIASTAGRVSRLARNLDTANQIPDARLEAERAAAAWREVA